MQLLARRGLLRGLEACDARVYRFVAGSGFGKSTLAWELADRSGHSSLCDLRGVRTEIDAWRRLITAAAKLDSANGERIIEESLTLDSSERAAYLSAIGSRGSFRGTLLIDNADDASSAGTYSPVRAFIGARPSCTVIVCSRTALPLDLPKNFAPHEFVTIREADLRFDLDDLRALLDPDRRSAAQRALEWSGGWPLAAVRAVALLQSGSDLPSSVAAEQWLRELVEETMNSAAGPLREALVRMAAIRDMPLDELPREGLAAIPFVSQRPDAAFELHALAREEISRLYPDACAQSCEALLEQARSRGDHLRCAELALQQEDFERAGDALARVDQDYYEMPSPRYVAVLERLDRRIVLERPALWMVCEVCLQSDFLPVAEELEPILRGAWNTLAPGTRMACIALVCFRKAEYSGEWEQAWDLLDDFERTADPQRLPTRDRLYSGLFRCSVASNCGWDFDEAAFWRTYGQELSCSKILLGEYLYLEATRSYFRGDRQRVLSALERYVAVLRACGHPLQLRAALYRALALPWELDAREQHERYRNELIEVLQKPTTPNDLLTTIAWEMLDASQGVAPFGEGPVRATGCLTNLMIAACADDYDEMSSAMERAVAMAPSRTLRLLAVHLRVAAFAYDPSHEGLLDSAFSNFKESACPQLRLAVRRLREGKECGILDPLVQRFRASGRRARNNLFVDVTKARIRRGGAEVRLGDRELELLMLLAAAGRPVPALEAAELIWSESDDHAARNALKVCISRIRAHTGSKDVIVTSGGDLSLPAVHVQTDLARAERLLGLARHGSVAAGRAARAILERPLPERYRAWGWVNALEERLISLKARAVTSP